MTAPWDDPRVQRGMKKLLALRSERMAAGDKAVGWKVAFGAKAIQEKLGIGGPLVGFLSQGAAVGSGASVSVAGWVKPVAEPEVAVYMGTDLPGGSSEEAARAAIARLGPAIELIDSQRPPEDPEAVLAGNIAHRYVVLGPAARRHAGGQTDGLKGLVFRRGAEFARTSDVEAMPGPIPGLIRHVANYLSEFGERLRAGDIVICGSIVTPVAIEPDESEFTYKLDPIGEVSVRFVRG